MLCFASDATIMQQLLEAAGNLKATSILKRKTTPQGCHSQGMQVSQGKPQLAEDGEIARASTALPALAIKWQVQTAADVAVALGCKALVVARR